MSNTTKTDALVTAEDILQIKAEIDRGDFKRLVFELVAREPDLAIVLSAKHDLVTTMLEGAALSFKHRAILTKQLSLLVWTPLLLLDRAHRRSWNEFLPSEDVTREPGAKGGVE